MTRLAITKQVEVWCRRMGLRYIPTDIVTCFMKTYKPYTVADYKELNNE